MNTQLKHSSSESSSDCENCVEYEKQVNDLMFGQMIATTLTSNIADKYLDVKKEYSDEIVNVMKLIELIRTENNQKYENVSSALETLNENFTTNTENVSSALETLNENFTTNTENVSSALETLNENLTESIEQTQSLVDYLKSTMFTPGLIPIGISLLAYVTGLITFQLCRH
jgi:dihydroorotate dehydrogenase